MQIAVAKKLAQLAVDALIAEVSLTPKPGLVDRLGSNSHDDMDWALLVCSAETLYPIFYKIAEVAYRQPIDQRMRENIAVIGRQGELLMLQKTGGINTHKGAVWTLGLMISVLSSIHYPDIDQLDDNFRGVITVEDHDHAEFSSIISLNYIDVESVLQLCGQLASFSDRNYQSQKLTKGEALRRKYRVRSAAVEAAEGFPTLLAVLRESSSTVIDGEERYLNWLLQLIVRVEDTCVLSRSDFSTLRQLQALAQKALLTQDLYSEKGVVKYQKLCEFALSMKVSPGGSADLLAGLIFLEKAGLLS